MNYINQQHIWKFYNNSENRVDKGPLKQAHIEQTVVPSIKEIYNSSYEIGNHN
jgi:hypothetical protein